MQSVVVHGHFYQPPRENPWRGDVDPEPTAAPFHDWNERITHECYQPVSAARVLDAAGHVVRTVNLFEWLSFDGGTTLLRWLEHHAPAVYRLILDGDRASARRLGGHGNAIAMPYHHVILPLASRRDKEIEVRWGLADFRRRFGRDARGMWLPETAVDEETLDVLAQEGVQFTIVAPHQVENATPSGEPLLFTAGRGRQVALCTYDGELSSAVAFGPMLDDGDALARRLAPDPDEIAEGANTAALVSLATDGETFGHHHKFGEMALARAFALLATRPSVRVENFATILAREGPRREARLVSPSSWSCPHGVERWKADCGCRVVPGTSQAWRGPLRAALDWLARELDIRLGARGADVDDPAARARMGMFSSCAWFFDDLAGHETILMLRLAAYAIDLVGDDAIEEGFVARLAAARSNDPAEGDGAAVYHKYVRSARVAA